MPSNYGEIRAENIREYGEGTDHLSFFDELYSDRTHFIFELLQNAEDAGATKILFSFIEDQLEVSHDGRPFNAGRKDDVRGICGVGKGTKAKDLTQIGKFGIGFKSVYAYTATPEIHSGDEHFCIEHYVRPYPAAPREPGNGWTTLFVLSLDAPKLKPENARDEIARRLQNMSARTLLFLRNIEKIEYELPDQTGGFYLRGETKRDQARQVSVIGQNKGPDEDETWLVFERPVRIPNSIDDVCIELGFRLMPAENEQAEKIVRVNDSPLVVYFPTEKPTQFGFLVQGPYRTTPARDNIRQNDDWNLLLIKETALLITEALMNLRDMGLLTVSLLEALPIRTEDFPKDGTFYPIVEAVHGALREHELLPADNGTSVSARNGKLAHSAELRKLLTDRQLRALWQTNDNLKWLSGEITQDRTPDLRSFLINKLGVNEINLEAFVRRLSADFLRDMDDEWFVALYRYLRSHVSAAGFQKLELARLPIVPVVDNEQGVRRLSCDKHQPIYFSRTEADRDTLASVPAWLSELVPIAFLDAEFLRILDGQEDQKDLREWFRDALNVYGFSIANYCVDVLSKLTQTYGTLEDNRLVAATAFLAQHAGPTFDWENLPIILSDGRRMLLRDARKLLVGQNSTGVVQTIVVPDNYDPESGWQHIWQSQQDRKHFVRLSKVYSKDAIEGLIATRSIVTYPLPERLVSEYTPQTVTHVIEDYRAPKAMPVNGQALVSWLRDKANEKIAWPKDTSTWNFGGQKYELEWACKKDYYEQDGHPYRVQTGNYQFWCAQSSFLEWLCATSWLPSTKGLVRPSQAFLPKPGIKDFFGDTVPYFEGELPENILNVLGVHSEVSVKDLLDLLREQSSNDKANPDMVERIYSQLAASPRTFNETLRPSFSYEAWVLAKDGHGAIRWCKSDDCVWEDASAVLGDDFAYLSAQYPKLQDFFVEKLGVKRRVDTECYAQKWLKLQENPVADVDQRRVLVEQLYREIRPVAQTTEASRPQWWCDFSKSLKVYTKSDTFEPPTRVVLPDDGMYREIFQGSAAFAWRPEKDAFDHWASFYRALGTPLLSETVTEHFEDNAVEHELLARNRFVTEATVKMIAAWLREKQNGDYERLLKDGSFARLASLREARTSSDIKVEFRLRINTVIESRPVTYPVFWKRADGILIYADAVEKSQIAKAIAKGLLENRAYRDLADWIELVLEARDTERLRRADWSVPQPILDLFPRIAPVPNAPEASLVAAAEATVTQPSSEAAAPPASQPAQAASPQEPAFGQHPDVTDQAPKADGQQQTPRTPISDRHPHQGSQDAFGKPRQPQDIEEPGAKKADDPNPPSNEPRESHTTPGFSYAEELAKAFNRDGMTHFNDEDEPGEYHAGGGMSKNPQRRSERLATGYRESIDNEPPPQERLLVTERSLLEGPNEAVRGSLREWYRGKCQICGKTWPKQDGEPYFAAAYLVERHHGRWLDNPGNAICLCAEHFAQWRHAAKEMPLEVVEQIHSLRLHAEGGDGDLSIYFTLLGEDVAIRYDERHLLALKIWLR
jgi:hypothetical protein